MKTLLCLILLSMSSIAFAGPEEHKAAQTCYTMIGGPAPLTENIPTEICLETVTLDLSQSKIKIYSYFNSSLYKEMQLTKLSRKNENVYLFKASGVLLDQPANMVCGSVEKVALLISGQANNDGEVDPRALTVTVSQNYTADDCHMTEAAVVYQYMLN